MAKKLKLYLCTKGKACKKRGAKNVLCALEQEIEKYGLAQQICLKKTSCLGKCGKGPTVEVQPLDRLYGYLTPAVCEDFVKALKKKAKPPKQLRIS